MSDHHCDCGHEHCQKLVPPPKASTYPLTMENLVKGVKNINAIIDLIDTRKDENREQMMIFIKIFCDDLVYRFKQKDKPEDKVTATDNNKETKEPDMPIMERINKSLIQLIQLKPAVMIKYGNELLDKIWELNDEVNEYIPCEEFLSQPIDRRLSNIELMKYFLKLFFGAKNKVDDLLEKKYIIINEEKRKIIINEDMCNEIGANPDKYLNENNLLSNLMIIKILSYTNSEVFYTGISSLLMALNNSVIKFYKLLSLYSFSLWTLTNKKDDLIKSLLYIIGGVLKDFCRSLFKTENIDIKNLIYFKEKAKEEHFFKDIVLPEKSVNLLKNYLLLTMVNFIGVFLTGYDADKPFDILDGNYFDDYFGYIIRLKDPKLTEKELNEIPRMIPLSLNMKTIAILFLSDFLFLFCTHFCFIENNQLKTDFKNFENLKYLAQYMIINSNHNILTFFEKNCEFIRFEQCYTEKMEYQVNNNFNTYGLFFVLFSLLKEKKVPLIINKKAYVGVMSNYLKIVMKEAKDFGIPDKREILMKYFVDELKKIKMINLDDEDLKKIL